MKILIQYLGISVSTKVLSGGESAYLIQLARKSDSGNKLSHTEKDFVLSMASRSKYAVRNH